MKAAHAMSVSSTRCYRRYSWSSKHSLSLLKGFGSGCWGETCLAENGSQPNWKPASVWSQGTGCSQGQAYGFPGSVKRWYPTSLRVLKKNKQTQHSWEHQTQSPDPGMSNLINFVCISTETNMLLASKPRSQRLGF